MGHIQLKMGHMRLEKDKNTGDGASHSATKSLPAF